MSNCIDMNVKHFSATTYLIVQRNRKESNLALGKRKHAIDICEALYKKNIKMDVVNLIKMSQTKKLPEKEQKITNILLSKVINILGAFSIGD